MLQEEPPLDDEAPRRGEADTITSMAMWKRNVVLENHVALLRVREKRILFVHMRSKSVDEHTLFPNFGMTAGEFAFWHIVADAERRKRESPQKGTAAQ